MTVQFKMNFEERSIPLIATDSNNQFYLTKQARQLLMTLDKPVAVVSIAGVYRTGKSYLINKLLKTKQVGFQTGSTTQSVTKGLNMWGRPVVAEDEFGHEMLYIVIDSEGIGSCEQQLKYDIKLLMLVFLISSTVVYNSMGAIDEVALDQLRVVVNLKQTLISQPPQQKTKFVWVLRDFSLQLVDKYGCEITSNQYLQQCLQQAAQNGVQARKKNEIRKAIKQGLGKKCCFTLVRPTINEQDLADLTKCKLRTEFLREIEAIRQEVFSGSRQDIKKIGGTMLNGRLLASLLQECISVLNNNRVPEIQTLWQSVREVAYEETFQEMRESMKRQMSKLVLPLPHQQMKNQLNDIQNKFYNQLEREFTEFDSFKKYHKEFLRYTQKINKDIKLSNKKFTRQNVIKDLRQFVKLNISFPSIEPTNLSLLKVLVDRMELKVKAEPEGYEYVLSVLFDLMHISEQKAIVLQREVSQQRKVTEMGMAQRKNYDISIISLKQDYHQALKTINNLKVTQEEIEKQCALHKQQNDIFRSNISSLQHEIQTKQSSFIRQIEEVNLKTKQRNEEMSSTIKRLRQQNMRLQNQISLIKEERLREVISDRKEVIFEEKIKQSWEKFEQERRFLRTEIDRHRKTAESYLTKYEQEKKSREKENQQIIKQREAFLAKEKQFVKQLLQMRNLHAETKKTYCATFDVLKDNDRVFRSIENVSLSNSKIASCRKAPTEDKEARKYYESELEKINNQHEEQVRQLNDRLSKTNRLCEQLKLKSNEQQNQLKLCLQEKYRLQSDLMVTSERFADTVSEIQIAKQRERSLYEQSIVRLLSNIQKRQSLQLGSHRR